MRPTFLGYAVAFLLLEILYLLWERADGLDENAAIARLIGLLVTGVLVLLATFLKPLRPHLEDLANRLYQPARVCRIFIFGLSRAGKTTLIKRLMTNDTPEDEKSTEKFDVWENNNHGKYKIEVADYKGSKPSEVTSKAPQAFFGPEDRRSTNLLLFVVDLFPEILNRQGNPIPDDRLVARYRRGALEKIRQRVAKNHEWVSENMIEIVFSVAHSPPAVGRTVRADRDAKLVAVRLVITKIDLLLNVWEKGFLDGAAPKSRAAMIKKLYREVENRIRTACADNNIEDYATVAVDGKTSTNVHKLWGELLERYELEVLQ